MNDTKTTEEQNQEVIEQSELEQTKQQLADMKELAQRTQANFENYRKQMEKRMEDFQKIVGKQIILQLLPIIDNFELTIKNSSAEKEHILNAIELIYAQMNTLLENNGITAIETENKEFDRYLHEALIKVESEKRENTIVEELQRGFTLNGQVIRHAKVKISAGKGK